jgi:long-chain fatty acid transport protein
MKKVLTVVLFLFCVVSVSVLVSAPAFATNGMNMEGYGPIATGMGGASMAYDNGTAALMNNPATLGFMPEGNRFDLAFGYLGPHVISKMSGMSDTRSSADAFFMPALGWAQKSGKFSYGLGLFSQGGMGAEYGKDSFLAAGSGDQVRSELGVGRLLIPLTYEITKNFIIGGTVDFVWASLDLKMALSGAQFSQMVSALGGNQAYGSASGSMVNILAGAFSGGALTSMQWARFDFSDNKDFTGSAKGYGAGGKIGAVYRATDKLTFGATYHSKTALSDMQTDRNAIVSMNVSGPGVGGGPVTIPVTGKIAVKDFQWPQMVAAGVAYRPFDKLLLVFDYKWINWSDVMKNFKLSFNADQTQSNPFAAGFGLGGQSMNATLIQNWKDQHVFMLGAGFMATDALTLRVGYNYGTNPIPDTYMNPLFPAIIKHHIMMGAGYLFTKASSVDVAFTYAPEETVTSGQNVTTKHSQTNAQLMYSYRF